MGRSRDDSHAITSWPNAAHAVRVSIYRRSSRPPYHRQHLREDLPHQRPANLQRHEARRPADEQPDVQGIFDDLNLETRSLWKYPDGSAFDADRNTHEFIEAMPGWRKQGLLGFDINLQGGSPQGYSNAQPWHNSAFTEAGELRPAYMARLEKILDKADELGWRL